MGPCNKTPPGFVEWLLGEKQETRRLKARIRELEDALRPFAVMLDRAEQDYSSMLELHREKIDIPIPIIHLRKAKEVLDKK